MVGHCTKKYIFNAVGIALLGGFCCGAYYRANRAIPHGIALNNNELHTHHRGIPIGIAVIVGYIW